MEAIYALGEGRKQGLDTWYVVKGMDSMRNPDDPLSAGPEADESNAGSCEPASVGCKFS
jgi:hypothetical protein